MPTVGYVDIAYADEYVKQHYRATEDFTISWSMLSEEDKEVLLRRSFESIEALPFPGKKTTASQSTMFPRWPDETVPDAIKGAQVENALFIADGATSEESSFYNKLRNYGVESYSIGNLSEHSSKGGWGKSALSESGIVSPKAAQLLSAYMCGSYAIRGGRR